MAFIPKNVKLKKGQNNVSTEMVIGIGGAVLIFDSIIGKYIHPSVSFVMLIIVGVVIAYLVLPSSANYGSVGYQRLMNLGRYKLKRLKIKGLRK